MAADPAPSPALHPPRLALLDQARGVALVAMIIYHAIWDGLTFGLIDWSLGLDMAMRNAARLIAGSFLMISGVALALAADGRTSSLLSDRRFQRRLALLIGAAGLVSLATTIALPAAPIYFGILHHLALAAILLALVARQHAFWIAALAAAALLVDHFMALEAFNHPALIWTGLGTRAPVTADWVPLFPWIATGLLGMAIGKRAVIPWLATAPRLAARSGRDPLAWMGRHSLAIYLIHQPILIGGILAWQGLFG